MKLVVSVALDTGLWAPVGTFVGRTEGPADGAAQERRGFSSVDLSGTVASASVLSRVAGLVDTPSLLDQLEVALGGDTDHAHVVRVDQQDRDIDGSTVMVEVEVPDDLSWPVLARIADTIVDWSDWLAVAAHGRRREQDFRPLASSGVQPRKPSALWAHTVVVCERGVDDPTHRCGHDAAQRLLPSDLERVELPSSEVSLALHASLVCTRDPTEGRRVADLVDELHGWWTATWTLDQALLRTATSMAETLSAGEYQQLGTSADVLADVTTSTGILRTRLDSFRLSLGGLEWPVWDAATRRWALEDNLMSLERKRVVLGDITTAFRGALDSHHSARLNQLAAFFAVVSAVASFVAVVLFLFPSLQDPAGVMLRLVLVLVALATSMVAIFWSSRFVLRMSRQRRQR